MALLSVLVLVNSLPLAMLQSMEVVCCLASQVVWGGGQVALEAARTAARLSGSSVNQDANPLMLPTVAAGLYLKALAKQDFDPFSAALVNGGYSPVRHQLTVKWHLFRNTF